MTVVVTALNKQAAAVAADSAVTFGGGSRKVFNSANKIFTLSSAHPVCAAVYGGAELNGIPWETIVKEYRAVHGTASCPDVATWARDLIGWLEQAPFLDGDTWTENVLESEFLRVLAAASDAIEDDPALAPEDAIAGALATALDYYRSPGSELSEVPDGFEQRMRDERGALIDGLIAKRFSAFAGDKALRRQLTDLAIGALTRMPRGQRELASGVVVVGFGHDQYLPGVSTWEFAGVADGYLRRRHRQTSSVSDVRPSLVLPYAQVAEVQTFLEGVHPDYRRLVDNVMESVLIEGLEQMLKESGLDEAAQGAARERAVASAKAIAQGARDTLREFRHREYRNPVRGVAALLPKDELAALAESLCAITALKRRVSPVDESVGGPVDVAVISRGDGVVWIKRKHYFPAELNRRFLN